MPDQAELARRLEALHAAPTAWFLPNPWDGGSAAALEAAGFEAVATSSAAFAGTLGAKDGEPDLAAKLDHCRGIVNAISIPVTVDFEDGFAETPAEVASNIARLAETGVAGCSIEDFSRSTQTLFDRALAIERIQAAVEAVKQLPFPFQLTARAEGLLRQQETLDEVIGRLQAFDEAGAHVLYAPALKTLDEVQTVKSETNKPLNVLAPFLPKVTLDEFTAAGATRLSLGGALYAKVMQSFSAAAKAIAADQTYSG